MYKHIIFDFDGTIVDSSHAIVAVYNELAAEYRFKQVSRDEFKLLNNLSLKERFKALNIPMYRFLLIRKISKQFKIRYHKYLHSIQFIDGMKEVLEALLQKGFKVSVITSNSAANATEFLSRHGIHSLHDVQTSKGLFGKHQTIRKYMKDNVLNSRDVVYIGDEQRDVIACKKNKIDSIGVTWGIDTKDLLSSVEPRYMIEQPNEIIHIVAGQPK